MTMKIQAIQLAHLIFALLINSHSIKCYEVQSLNGIQWIVTNHSTAEPIKAKVPGSIYSDLILAGKIGEIYLEDRDVQYRWVAYSNWTYTTKFDATKILNNSKVYLTCHGLDTFGTVYLNGKKLGSVSNQFVRYKFPVKSHLVNGSNLLMVEFESAPIQAKLLHHASRKMDNYTVPPESCHPNMQPQHGECYVNMIRKMQSSFSWDWGPAFPTQGIWQPIELEGYTSVTLRSLSVETRLEPNSTQKWFLNTTVWLEDTNGTKVDGEITLYLNGTKLNSKNFSVEFDTTGEAPIVVLSPVLPEIIQVKPWFPNGVGEQPLYTLKAEVKVGPEVVTKQVKIGFRTVELVQDRLKVKPEAYTFYFKINGIPIFAKGSNWIPAHALHEAVTREYLEDLFRSTKEANMNMLRVWGGGIYEDDVFYELADQYGILIWHDMMFACALYPGDQEFLTSVETEIRQQIRRLQHHPSIALWAGNNEIEGVLVNFYHNSPLWKKLSHDYRNLFAHLIPSIITREDPSRPYVPSSPSNGLYSAKENYTGNVGSGRYGDIHHYVYSGDTWSWQIYPSAKFVSEYGFQSLPSLRTLKKYLKEEELRYPISKALEHRQHQGNGLEYLTNSIARYLPKPKTLDDFIYMSQIFQAMSIKIETEFYRRNRQIDSNGDGQTMGALYWQLNQIWPGFSWSSIEYGGRWKMLHYYVRNAFENLHLDIYEQDHKIKVTLVNDVYGSTNQKIEIKIEVYDWSKPKATLTKVFNATIEPFSVRQVFEASTESLLHEAKCQDRFHCFLQVGSNAHAQTNFLFLEPIKNANGLRKATISLKNVTLLSEMDPDLVSDLNSNSKFKLFELEFESNQIAPFTWLELDDDNSRSEFSENGFHLIGSKRVLLQSPLSGERIKSLIRVKSLADFY